MATGTQCNVKWCNSEYQNNNKSGNAVINKIVITINEGVVCGV